MIDKFSVSNIKYTITDELKDDVIDIKVKINEIIDSITQLETRIKYLEQRDDQLSMKGLL